MADEFSCEEIFGSDMSYFLVINSNYNLMHDCEIIMLLTILLKTLSLFNGTIKPKEIMKGESVRLGL